MAYSDPYEEWKANGRQGPAPGSQPAPAALPPPPPNAQTAQAPQGGMNLPPPPPPPKAAPAPQFNSAAGQGTGSAQSQAEFQAAYANGQRGSDPNAIFGPGGATQYRADYNAAQGGNRPEDMARFSDQTLAGWDQLMVKDGPNKGKYLSMRGEQGYFDKPTECPPGKVPSGPHETDPCVGNGEAAGGGGAGGAGGGGVGGGGFSSGAMDDMQKFWMDQIKGQGTRYTPEAMAALEADQFSRARAQEKNQLDQSRQDMAQRGTARSASQNAAVRQIGVGTGQQIMQNRAQVQKAKIDADYQDKQAAINNAQNYVNSMRDWLLRNDSNAIQREQIQAQIRLATQNIAAQKDMLEQNYQNNLSTNFLLGNAG